VRSETGRIGNWWRVDVLQGEEIAHWQSAELASWFAVRRAENDTGRAVSETIDGTAQRVRSRRGADHGRTEGRVDRAMPEPCGWLGYAGRRATDDCDVRPGAGRVRALPRPGLRPSTGRCRSSGSSSSFPAVVSGDRLHISRCDRQNLFVGNWHSAGRLSVGLFTCIAAVGCEILQLTAKLAANRRQALHGTAMLTSVLSVA
jgi:hypothetical protein